ncbi:MAG TPA: carbon monoxide dehydrogenase, partial [Candidatus Sumerlaeota bacterium]|nr:carbon monoxide dehydrogenase [Candidatus Sumerlaeota bacterium]
FSAHQQHYRKVGTREAQAISKVVFAGARGAAGVRLAWGSLAPTTIRAHKTEAAIQNGADANAAWEILQTEIAPIDDIRSTAEYRRKVTRNILHEFMGRVPAGK